MSPSCDNCGAHVTTRYKRVRCGNDGKLHGCPECTDPATRERQAAGLDSQYRVRSTPAGYTAPREVADD